MNNSFEQLKEKIIAELNARNPNPKCPACGNSELNLIEGFFAHDLQTDLTSRQIGGKNVPTVPIVCSKCGYIMEFALGSLGLLPKPPEK